MNTVFKILVIYHYQKCKILYLQLTISHSQQIFHLPITISLVVFLATINASLFWLSSWMLFFLISRLAFLGFSTEISKGLVVKLTLKVGIAIHLSPSQSTEGCFEVLKFRWRGGTHKVGPKLTWVGFGWGWGLERFWVEKVSFVMGLRLK